MALFGAHLTITVMCAIMFVRIQKYYSAGRSLLTSGLFCYVPPSGAEIVKAAGMTGGAKKRGVARKINNSNGAGAADVADQQHDSTLVPNDVDLTLMKIRVQLPMLVRTEFYNQFTTMFDFGLMCFFNFALTEAYFLLIGEKRYTGGINSNLSVIWCILGALLAWGLLLTVLALYFSLESSEEKSACLLVGAVGFLLSLILVLFSSDMLFDFGINQAQTAISTKLSNTFEELHVKWNQNATVLLSKLAISVLCSVITAMVAFPAYRSAKMFFDATEEIQWANRQAELPTPDDAGEEHSQLPTATSNGGRTGRMLQLLMLTINFIAPILMCVLWLRPVRDIWNRQSFGVSYDLLRFACAFGVTVLRLLEFRPHLQAHLDLPGQNLAAMRRSAAQRITVRDIQRKVASPLRSVSLVAIQYTAPFVFVFLLMCAALGMRWYAHLPPTSGSGIANLPIPDDAKRQASLVQDAFMSLLSAQVLVPLAQVLVWWTYVSYSALSSLALLYHRRAAAENA